MSKADQVRHHAAVENQHDMAAMLATLADDDPVRDEVAGKVYRGVEDVAKRYAELWEAFPDFTVAPTRLTEDADTVVMEADYSGTQKGVFNGRPPTGKSFEVRIVVVFRFRDGKIASETIFLDSASQQRQLGLLRE